MINKVRILLWKGEGEQRYLRVLFFRDSKQITKWPVYATTHYDQMFQKRQNVSGVVNKELFRVRLAIAAAAVGFMNMNALCAQLIDRHFIFVIYHLHEVVDFKWLLNTRID